MVTKHNSDVGRIIKFDVTDAVKANPDAKEYCFVLYCDHVNNSDAVSNLALFCSKENTDASSIPPKMFVYSGGEKETQAEAQAADETSVRFELAAKSGTFLRVKENALMTGRNISPLSDARFIEKTGPAGSNTVCFESEAAPGMYLCRKYGASEVVLMKDDGSENFRKNSSFVKTKGLTAGTSYEAFGEPGRMLCVQGQNCLCLHRIQQQRKQLLHLR